MTTIDIGPIRSEPITTPAISLHKFYRRWSSFVQRCYNTNSPHWKNYGGRGIAVAEIWGPQNPQGAKNFVAWVEAQLLLKPDLDHETFEVNRKKVDLDYSPDNCELVPEGWSVLKRRNKVLTIDEVVKLRRYKKANPDVTLADMETKFDHSIENISRCLRGLTWSCANALEAPLNAKSSRAEFQKPSLPAIAV